MHRHGKKRTHPDLLVENTRRVISCRMDYLPDEDIDPQTLLEKPSQAFVSRYALGRDYHKILRKRLQKLVNLINSHLEGNFPDSHQARVFVDSPVWKRHWPKKPGLAGLVNTPTCWIEMQVPGFSLEKFIPIYPYR